MHSIYRPEFGSDIITVQPHQRTTRQPTATGTRTLPKFVPTSPVVIVRSLGRLNYRVPIWQRLKRYRKPQLPLRQGTPIILGPMRLACICLLSCCWASCLYHATIPTNCITKKKPWLRISTTRYHWSGAPRKSSLTGHSPTWSSKKPIPIL